MKKDIQIESLKERKLLKSKIENGAGPKEITSKITERKYNDNFEPKYDNKNSRLRYLEQMNGTYSNVISNSTISNNFRALKERKNNHEKIWCLMQIWTLRKSNVEICIIIMT